MPGTGGFTSSPDGLPEKIEGVYTPGVFARLLLARAQLLQREGGFQDKLLGRAFIELATEMDPRNEDAVYAFELQRIDHGDFDWKLITDYKETVKKVITPESGAERPEEPEEVPKPDPKSAATGGPPPRRGPPGGR